MRLLRVDKARVKRLFKGHTDLILGFNTFLPKRHQFHGKKLKKVEENGELPLKVLDIIYKRIEFVLVILCTRSSSLHVYQSRNCGWVTYSTSRKAGRIVDFVVLHNIIYVVTHKVNIGVLSLNSAYIKFLKLKSTPNVTGSWYLRLVNCDEQLLVAELMIEKIRNVYKIDFSTMNYVKLNTLGDIALFYASIKKCYALSNPNKWGYKSNSVYVIPAASTKCSVYSGDDKKLQKYITPPAPRGTHSLLTDWCFRHRQYEVDYSLVE